MRQWSDSRQFSEILEEKLNKSPDITSQNPKFSAHVTSSLREQLSQLGLKKITFTNRSYPHSQKKPAEWKPIGLSKNLTEAFEFFHLHGETLITDKSNALSLKRAFRRLAKKLHPDRVAHLNYEFQSKNAALFRHLQIHYKEIETFLNSKNKAAA